VLWELSAYEAVHWISKEARYKIIEIMLATRSARQLALELGVSPAAINKYLSRRMHPSDQTIARALQVLYDYERERIYQVIVDDIINALSKLVDYVSSESEYLKRYTIERLNDLLRRLEGDG